MNLFGSNNLGDVSHKKGTLLDQFPKKRNLQRYMTALSGLALSAASSLSFGLGLGDIEPKSFLGQPLAANIELVSLDGDLDLESLLVRQVPAGEAEKMGVDIFYSGYRFDLKIDQSSGKPKITLVSKNSIDEPYLNVLVELRWPSGVVYREYPLLLDPPPLVPVSSVESKAKPVAQVKKSVQPKKPASRPASATSPRAPSPSSIKPGKGDVYKVQSGDTLWSIAKRWKEGSSLTTNETMDWLHQNNPEAFANGDMNKLRAGARLSMPDVSNLNLDDGLLPAPTRSLVDTEKSAPLEPVAAQGKKKELEVVETKSVIDAADRPEQGLLVVSSDLQDDRSRELIDMLERENEDLKGRMEKIENSEYLSTLKQLVSLQRRQISELRVKLGERDTTSEEMSALLTEADVDINSEVNTQSASDVQEDIVAIEEGLSELESSVAAEPSSEDVKQSNITEEQSVVELEPVLANPPEVKEDKSLVTWLVFGAGAFLAMIFAFLLIYYRKMVPTKTRNDYEEHNFSSSHAYSGHFDNSSESEENTRIPSSLAPAIDYDGENPSEYHQSRKVSEGDWLGEKADDVDTFDAGAFDNAIQEVEDIFDSIEVDDKTVGQDSILEGMTGELPTELPEDLIAELSANPEEEFLDTLSPVKPEPKERRADNEVLSSIAAKMSQYNPKEFKKGSDSLGLLEIDEAAADQELDEVDATISRAKMFCEFSQYERARDLITKSMVSSSDVRYEAAMSMINEEQASVQNEVLASELDDAAQEDTTQIEGFTTSLDDDDEAVEATVAEASVEASDELLIDKVEAFSVEFDDEDEVAELAAELDSSNDEIELDEELTESASDDVTEFLYNDATEVLSEGFDTDNVAGDLLEDALKIDLSEEALNEGNLDLDLDINLDFSDVDLDQDIQIDDIDDDMLGSKKKEQVSC